MVKTTFFKKKYNFLNRLKFPPCTAPVVTTAVRRKKPHIHTRGSERFTFAAGKKLHIAEQCFMPDEIRRFTLVCGIANQHPRQGCASACAAPPVNSAPEPVRSNQRCNMLQLRLHLGHCTCGSTLRSRAVRALCAAPPANQICKTVRSKRRDDR